MKGAVLYGPGDVRVEERADPTIIEARERGGWHAGVHDAGHPRDAPRRTHRLRRGHGVGIPADELEAFFELFVPVGRSPSRPGEGTGSGSRSAATWPAAGRDLSVKSEPGAGSTFTLTLPRA
jgi:signal transduction histidine kinase